MNNIGLLVPPINFTPVSNNFIDDFLKDTHGDFIKVYIFCLRHGYAGNMVSIKDISSALNLIQSDVLKALDFFEEKSVIRMHPEGIIEILPYISKEPAPFNPALIDKNVEEMLHGIQENIGRPMSPKEMSVYTSFIENYNLTPEVVTLLVEYCTSKKKTDIRYIEKVAIAWHEADIKTIKDAQEYISKHEEKWVKYRELLSFLGFKESEISKPVEEIFDKWLINFKFPIDMIKEASRICIMRINEANLNYIDAILSDWHKNGILTMESLNKSAKGQGKRKKTSFPVPGASKNERQYDPKELENKLLGRIDPNEE